MKKALISKVWNSLDLCHELSSRDYFGVGG
jgi:hypothetical protein